MAEVYKVDSSIIENLKREFAQFDELKKIEDLSEVQKEDYYVSGENVERLVKRIFHLLNIDEIRPFVSVAPIFNRETLRSYIDSLGVSSSIKDDNIVIILSSDNDFPFDVVMIYAIEGQWLRCTAYPVGCDINDNKRDYALSVLNAYNKETRMFKSYLDDEGTVWLERQDLIDSCLRNHEMKSILGAEMSMAWSFFKDYKDFFLSNKKD